MRNLHTTSASIATLEEMAALYGISSIILMATYFPLKGTGVHNLDLLERTKGRSLFRVFGSLDVMNNPDGGLSELTELAKAGRLAGIKLYPGYQGFEPGDQRLDGVYALAAKHNLPVMFHGGELHHCCPPVIKASGLRPCGFDHCDLDRYMEMAEPKFVEKPARLHPHVKFVVSHLANPYFTELRGVMRRCPNVFTDISGQFVSGTAEDTAEYRRLIVTEIWKFVNGVPNGHERIMFATDFPIQSYEDSLYLARSVTGPKRTPLYNNIMFRNALRVLDTNQRP